jgi:hypothetical protein
MKNFQDTPSPRLEPKPANTYSNYSETGFSGKKRNSTFGNSFLDSVLNFQNDTEVTDSLKQ